MKMLLSSFILLLAALLYYFFCFFFVFFIVYFDLVYAREAHDLEVERWTRTELVESKIGLLPLGGLVYGI